THTGHSLDEQTFGLHSDSPTAETLAQQAEDAAQVRQAIEQLPDDRRAVLVLRDMDGLDYSDIAEILEIPKGTVRSRLHRARADLREILEQSP
ncbi:MAG: sigma-70 family RNA polymerase sigma factor, partial [Planctomycetota bacterium]